MRCVRSVVLHYPSEKNHASFFYATAILLRSFLLAVAFISGKINAEQAFDAAFIEELWQNENWGTVEEAETRRRDIMDELKFLEAELGKAGT